MQHRTVQRGFTLIELVVVLTLISILSTIAIPQFQQSVYSARDVEAVETLGAIQRLMTDYYNANGQYPSVGGDWNPPDASGGGEQKVAWVEGQPGWQQISFKAEGQSYRFQYQFVPGPADAYGHITQVTLNAQADLHAAAATSTTHPKATAHQIILTNGAVTEFDQPTLE